MSSSRSLPEAVRGTWYFVPVDFDLSSGSTGAYQIYSMSVDGAFRRYQVKLGRSKLAESGDYTFDGNFLILRGRQTETFRVKRPEFWRWELEGKRKDFLLLRGLIGPEHFYSLSGDEARNLRILPLRAQIESDFDEGPQVHRIMYRTESEEKDHLLGLFFVEEQLDGKRWVGLTRLVEGLEENTWERILRDCYFDLTQGRPEDVTVVTLRFLDTDESRVFNYKIR